MTARDVLTIVRRRWPLLLLATLLGVLGGYLTTIGKDDEVQTYRGTHTLTVNNDVLDPAAAAEEGQGNTALTPVQYGVLIDRGAVPVAAAERLGYTGDPTALASQIDVEANDELGTIEVSYVDENPARAARVANAFAIEFVEYLNEQTRQAIEEDRDVAQAEIDQINQQISEIEAQLAVDPPPPNADSLETRLQAFQGQYTIAYERLREIAQRPTTAPVQTLERAVGLPVESGLSLPDNIVARLLLTGIIGLLVGVAVAMALEGIDTRIRDREQAEAAFGLPVVAEIPAMPRGYHGELVPAADRSVPLVEAYRGLATVLALYDAHASAEEGEGVETTEAAETIGAAERERSGQVVVIVSPGPGEGKTASVSHVAVAFAEVGRDVLVLDCDFHRPRLHEIFDIRQEAGLRDALAWHQGSRLDLVTHAASGVRVAPAGRAVGDPARLLASAPTLIDSARKDADIVLVDTPPIMAVSDAISLAALADAVLVVCRVGRTTRTAAERTRATLDRVGATTLGVVLTAVPQRGRGYYGYYGESRSATRTSEKPSRRERRRRRKRKGDLQWDDFPEVVTSVGEHENGAAHDVVDVSSGAARQSPGDDT
jgi:capsular exopolysaccharide synthesis family protein